MAMKGRLSSRLAIVDALIFDRSSLLLVVNYVF